MKTKFLCNFALASVLSMLALSSEAVPLLLDATIQCSEGKAINGIAATNVTGNNGGATDCWGTFDGNDPGPSGDGFSIDGMNFDFIAKEDTPGGLEGIDIGLVVTPSNGDSSGTWEYNPTLFNPEAFLIVLKAANSPGFAAWLFEGTDADSFSGDWLVAWTNAQDKPRDLSHLAIYAKAGNPNPVPEPGIFGLMGIGLLGVGLSRRRQKRLD